MLSVDEANRLAEMMGEAADIEIMPRFRRLSNGAIRQKTSECDLVTDADEATERRLTGALRTLFPQAAVIGEEAASADPGILDRIGEADLAIVVDPVDGTANFAAGVPLFGVMIAVICRNEVQCGIIHDPVGGDWVIALRGQGAWLRRADGSAQTVSVRDGRSPSSMIGAASWYHVPSPLREQIAANQARFASSVGFRCAAHEYRLLATGGCDFVAYHRLMPWDHAAGVLIVEEAGGHVAISDGSPYRPDMTTGRMVCATDPATWQTVCDRLFST